MEDIPPTKNAQQWAISIENLYSNSQFLILDFLVNTNLFHWFLSLKLICFGAQSSMHKRIRFMCEQTDNVSHFLGSKCVKHYKLLQFQ